MTRPAGIALDDISVAVCTFRRDSVADTLQSIAASRARDACREIIVVDNDDDRSAEARIVKAASDCGLIVRYLHAPSRNISIARNAALTSAKGRWLAFVDDDETVDAEWLAKLAAVAGGHAAVIGSTNARYAPDAPTWLRLCDFHSSAMNDRPESAYAGNALIDLQFVWQHRMTFDLSLGKTGGEDTLFFRQIADLGGRILYCPSSVVNEPVPSSRATLSWVLKRKFRSGQSHGDMMERTGRMTAGRRILLPIRAGAKAVACLGMAALQVARPAGWRKWLARGALHAGVVAHSTGMATLEEYRSVPNASISP